MKNGKIWGETEVIFKNDNFEVHRIFIKKNGRCSKHKHKYKHNIFYVETGILRVDVWKSDYDLLDKTELKSGEKTDVPPNEYHQFYAIDDTIAFEIYYSEPISNDIIRETVGGMVEINN